jgi:hypothetical protein
MLLVSVCLALGRHAALDQASSLQLPHDFATSVFDTMTRFLRRSSQVGYALAVIAASAALLTGEGRSARALRHTVEHRATASARWIGAQGWQLADTGTWVERHVAALRTAVVGVALIALIWWSSPTVAVVASLCVVALAVLFVLEVLRATTSVPSSTPLEEAS